MKATKLIEILQQEVEKQGDKIEVFIDYRGFGGSEILSIRDQVVIDGLGVKDLSTYDQSLMKEEWGDDDTGYIKGVVLVNKDVVSPEE